MVWTASYCLDFARPHVPETLITHLIALTFHVSDSLGKGPFELCTADRGRALLVLA